MKQKLINMEKVSGGTIVKPGAFVCHGFISDEAIMRLAERSRKQNRSISCKKSFDYRANKERKPK